MTNHGNTMTPGQPSRVQEADLDNEYKELFEETRCAVLQDATEAPRLYEREYHHQTSADSARFAARFRAFLNSYSEGFPILEPLASRFAYWSTMVYYHINSRYGDEPEFTFAVQTLSAEVQAVLSLNTLRESHSSPIGGFQESQPNQDRSSQVQVGFGSNLNGRGDAANATMDSRFLKSNYSQINGRGDASTSSSMPMTTQRASNTALTRVTSAPLPAQSLPNPHHFQQRPAAANMSLPIQSAARQQLVAPVAPIALFSAAPVIQAAPALPPVAAPAPGQGARPQGYVRYTPSAPFVPFLCPGIAGVPQSIHNTTTNHLNQVCDANGDINLGYFPPCTAGYDQHRSSHCDRGPNGACGRCTRGRNAHLCCFQPTTARSGTGLYGRLVQGRVRGVPAFIDPAVYFMNVGGPHGPGPATSAWQNHAPTHGWPGGPPSDPAWDVRP